MPKWASQRIQSLTEPVPKIKMEKKEAKIEKRRKKIVVGTRGRTFEGFVTKKFFNRVVVEFERTVFVPKYERFYKKKTKLHARIPEGLELNIGDYVKIAECRPLSKIIHFVALEIIKKADLSSENKEKVK